MLKILFMRGKIMSKPDCNAIRILVNNALEASSFPSEKIDAFVRILDTFSIKELIKIGNVLHMIAEDWLDCEAIK